MEDRHNFHRTERDLVLRAWENSTELVRDFKNYSQDINNDKLSSMFAEFAQDEGKHAAKLLQILEKYDK